MTAALAVVRAAALGCLLSLVVIGGLHTSATSASAHGAHDPSATDAYGRVVARAAMEQRCSPDGSTPGASGGSALIRTEGGQVRAVSFETGWDVFNGRHPGSLIAVCIE